MKSFECSICGTRFETAGTTAKYCPKCRIWKRHEANVKNSEARRKRATRRTEKVSINDVLRELDEYNRHHGTCYTYGQYMALRYSGRD